MELSFTAKTRVYCMHLGFLLPQHADGDLDCDGEVYITYRLLFNIRKDGLEWIFKVIDDIQVDLRVHDYAEDDFLHTTTLWWHDLKNEGWQLDTDRLEFGTRDGGFYITDAEIDFKRKVIALTSNAYQLNQ